MQPFKHRNKWQKELLVLWLNCFNSPSACNVWKSQLPNKDFSALIFNSSLPFIQTWISEMLDLFGVSTLPPSRVQTLNLFCTNLISSHLPLCNGQQLAMYSGTKMDLKLCVTQKTWSGSIPFSLWNTQFHRYIHLYYFWDSHINSTGTNINHQFIIMYIY